MHDLPLVVFTVLSQLAVGSLITLNCLDICKKEISLKTGRWITVALLILFGGSLLASLFHLGTPLGAYRALTNIGVSWLSREILFFSFYFVGVFLYLLQWKSGKENARKTVGGITNIIGILGVVSSAMIYVIPAVPAWNNASPIVFFLLTAAILGPLFVMSMIALLEKKEVRLFKFIIATIGVYALVTMMYVTVMFSGGIHLVHSAEQMVDNGLFWMRSLLSWILPLILFTPFILKRKVKVNSTTMIVTVFILVLVGEFVGRGIFYSSPEYLEVTKIIQ